MAAARRTWQQIEEEGQSLPGDSRSQVQGNNAIQQLASTINTWQGRLLDQEQRVTQWVVSAVNLAETDDLIEETDQLLDETDRRARETRRGLAAMALLDAFTAALSVPPQDRDAVGNPVVKREGSVSDPASGWPWEMVHEASGIVLVLAPAGEFEMGSPAGEAGRDDDEGPLHKVRFDWPFYLGKYEVTQEQWERVMGSNPSLLKGESRRPVECVSWTGAQGFVSKLNESLGGAAGLRFALPSEAQWEYGCRAGTTTRFSSGDHDSRLGQYGWYTGNALGQPHRVGEKQPNGWGLYDMHGNVREWCSDWYGIYPGGDVTDPKRPSSGSNRVFRGGGWYCDAQDCRSANRDRNSPSCTSNDLGFRVALVLQQA
ncbi:MAG: formylglycine-generating enzyme family protein [Verrucomicrobiales bacterium]|nr:formylglycine-generating enzyme family protein [Verrucomicrobiales bacterium]MCP5527902.1 formylglycine-generating enzyme family protein [Verrucomicrobiales bacterium]